jgi:Fe-S cluster biogenesis protein NfuA
MSDPSTIADGTSLLDRIMAALAYVRPYLQKDGGDVEFVRFEEETRTCEIRMVGSCQHCALAPLTLRAGVEKALIYRVPEIRRVERVR